MIYHSNPTLYIVGDSTLSSFNDPYFYPRYGYGTQLNKYFDSTIPIVNLALSGRSSKSFIQEDNYKKLRESFKKGDYLLIGFGHNDQKSDDKNRFTDARKPVNDSESFQYFLYEYYIKFVLEKEGTPILCTPIVRVDAKNCYSKNNSHITETGDYAQAIIDLGKEKNITVLNLRDLTKSKYQQIGFDEARNYHAVIAGKFNDQKDIIPNFLTLDPTHLNIYGARYVAYLVAKSLMSTNCSLKKYLLDTIIEPKKEDILFSNPNYQIKEYKSPNLLKYQPTSNFKTWTDGWYGTAFGDCGGIPTLLENGYVAKEVQNNTFLVGQHADSIKGKISFSCDGIAFLFKQIDVRFNFEVSVKAKVIHTENTKQAGFGLMLRDDCYLEQKQPTEIVASNYLAAGFLCKETAMSILFKKEGAEIEEPNLVEEYYKENEECELKIIRLGQSITISVEYQNKSYSKTYFDFDLLAVDQNYMYVGMFATRGTIVEFKDLNFIETGESQGA